MRSDAIDQILSTYLEMPARVSWRGALADGALGRFEGARLELAGVAVLALPFDRLVLEAERFQFTPGLPARIAATGPRMILSLDQRQLDGWLARSRAPFALTLTDRAVEIQADLAGFSIGRIEAEFAIQRGWFVLKPLHAELLGVRNRLAGLFRSYVPLPRLAPQTRLTGVEHVDGAIRLELTLDDFEDVITPGLVDRMQERFLPFAKPLAERARANRREKARSAARESKP